MAILTIARLTSPEGTVQQSPASFISEPFDPGAFVPAAILTKVRMWSTWVIPVVPHGKHTEELVGLGTSSGWWDLERLIF